MRHRTGWFHYTTLGLASLAIVATMVTGCPPQPGTPNIVQIAQDTPSLSTLVTAVQAADLTGTLSAVGPLTVFAPNNAAFNTLPTGVPDTLLQPDYEDQLSNILLGHVVAGEVRLADLEDGQTLTALNGNQLSVAISATGEVTVDGETVVTADILASNGVIHIINSVILPNIVETARATPSLSTLVAALEAADLANALEAPGPFTLFAPTNDAFAALPAGTLDDLLLPANKDRLIEVLQGHVVAGQLLAADLEDGDVLTDLNGNSLPVTVVDGTVSVDDDAQAVKPDIPVSNGVIHIIDKVILPPAN